MNAPASAGWARLARRGAVCAVVAASVMAGALPGPHQAAASFGVALPSAWEICVVEGVHAPLTADNVADLDLWQIAEGGSTQNDNSYNPFNTKRAVDGAGNPLPASISSLGFPAFADWAAGCAATTATILQPNMALIAQALQSGGESPIGFLGTVNDTPWCAPEDGTPCYAQLIADDAQPFGTGAAMSLFSHTSASVSAYAGQVSEVAAISGQLAAEQADLVAAEQAVATDQQGVQTALASMRSLAIYDYTSNTSVDNELDLKGFNTPDINGELVQYYENLDAENQEAAIDQAKLVLAQAQAHQAVVTSAIAQTSADLRGAQATLARTVRDMQSEAATFLGAAACLGVVPSSPSSASGGQLVSGLGDCVSSLA